MVHQHFTSVPAFTVAENVALAADWPVAPAVLRRRVRDLCERVGLPLDPDERAGRLSVGLKQRLEIVKALAADARVLLLDEPTAVLAPGEVEELLRVIRRFAAGGGAAVLITHKLDEALAGADRVTVLRKGRVVGSGPTLGLVTGHADGSDDWRPRSASIRRPGARCGDRVADPRGVARHLARGRTWDRGAGCVDLGASRRDRRCGGGRGQRAA